MITVKAINGSPEYIPKTTHGVHCDGVNFYFFESVEERQQFMNTLPVVWNKDAHCAEIELAVDGKVNDVLKQFWYISLGDVAATALNTKARWNTEAISVNEWQARCYELLEDYKLSVTESTAISPKDFIDTLPKFDN